MLIVLGVFYDWDDICLGLLFILFSYTSTIATLISLFIFWQIYKLLRTFLQAWPLHYTAFIYLIPIKAIFFVTLILSTCFKWWSLCYWLTQYFIIFLTNPYVHLVYFFKNLFIWTKVDFAVICQLRQLSDKILYQQRKILFTENFIRRWSLRKKIFLL